MTKSKKVALCGVMCALAFVFSYIDSFIILLPAIPGIKLGLANIVIMAAMYLIGISEAVWINLARIILSAILFTNAQSFLFSLCGAVLSMAVMLIIKKINQRPENKLDAKRPGLLEIVTVSEFGSIFHITGQLLAALLFFEAGVLAYYSFYLYLSAVICGILTGFISFILINRVSKESNN